MARKPGLSAPFLPPGARRQEKGVTVTTRTASKRKKTVRGESKKGVSVRYKSKQKETRRGAKNQTRSR